MSIRTGTEEKQQKPRSSESTSALWKGSISVGTLVHIGLCLYIHPTQQSPSIIVGSHFTLFFQD